MAEANTAVHGENQVERRLIGPREIAAYALTSYGLNNLTTYVGSTKQYFMMSFLGLSGTAYGTLSTIATVWDALDDPISGIIIDRCRFPLGQAAPVFDIPHAVLGDIVNAVLYRAECLHLVAELHLCACHDDNLRHRLLLPQRLGAAAV